MNTNEQLQDKLVKLQKLLVELNRVERSESCLYQLVLDEDGINSQHYGFYRYGAWSFDPRIKMRYFLVNIKTGKIVADGFKRRISQFLRSKKVELEKVLDIEILFHSSFDYFQSKMYEDNNDKIIERFSSDKPN